MRREAPDHLADTYTASSQELAREAACEAARTIQFIAATGLVPSNAKRSLPKGQFQNRMPGSDHDAAWFDPVAKTFVRTNEPYSRGGVTSEQKAWALRHGWAVAESPWKGMYRPDNGTSLFLLAGVSKGYSLEAIISQLASAQAPIVASNWDGESRPIMPAFISPGQATEIEAKSREIKTAEKRRGANNSIEYSMVLTGPRRRPKTTPLAVSFAILGLACQFAALLEGHLHAEQIGKPGWIGTPTELKSLNLPPEIAAWYGFFQKP